MRRPGSPGETQGASRGKDLNWPFAFWLQLTMGMMKISISAWETRHSLLSEISLFTQAQKLAAWWWSLSRGIPPSNLWIIIGSSAAWTLITNNLLSNRRVTQRVIVSLMKGWLCEQFWETSFGTVTSADLDHSLWFLNSNSLASATHAHWACQMQQM